jgi:hypothetical protein
MSIDPVQIVVAASALLLGFVLGYALRTYVSHTRGRDRPASARWSGGEARGAKAVALKRRDTLCLIRPTRFLSSSINGMLEASAIPPKRNRTETLCFSPHLYSARNLVERFFNKIKHCRRVATRYDKLAANYLAFVQLASIRLWLRVNESTP